MGISIIYIFPIFHVHPLFCNVYVAVGEDVNTQHNTLEFDLTRLIPLFHPNPPGLLPQLHYYVDIDITAQCLSTEP